MRLRDPVLPTAPPHPRGACVKNGFAIVELLLFAAPIALLYLALSSTVFQVALARLRAQVTANLRAAQLGCSASAPSPRQRIPATVKVSPSPWQQLLPQQIPFLPTEVTAHATQHCP